MQHSIRRSFVVSGTAALALATIPFAASGSEEPKVAEANQATMPASLANTGFYGALGIGVGLNSTIPLSSGAGSAFSEESFKNCIMSNHMF